MEQQKSDLNVNYNNESKQLMLEIVTGENKQSIVISYLEALNLIGKLLLNMTAVKVEVNNE